MKLHPDPSAVCERHTKVSADRAAAIVAHLRGTPVVRLPKVVAAFHAGKMPPAETALVTELLAEPPVVIKPRPEPKPKKNKQPEPPHLSTSEPQNL